ncbi:type II toxin-antitoxin system VapC family toxin [Herbiconiux moechotypicola]|uniref:Type II toxin-antitoxin system VapC family toxin n=1 Tax=Herbiconiux moechotypicola TaxID=637393 RepID=A0ABP5Q685_9MICO|nr:type II toxin-antitoxin system VapC family toxin [Herbiconiux moechotypicola]MCS5728248.1 type II toxin-antitoxin system VapC family toxin [Herbiconiux moechotypicola]
MRLLLDTHTLFWAVRDPTRIPATATALLTDPGNELLVSSVTPWEMGIKVRSGRFPEAAPFLAALPRYLEALGAAELPISVEHSLVAGQFEWEHRDPFDRMLGAQAIIENAVLVSADAVFATLGGVRLAWR